MYVYRTPQFNDKAQRYGIQSRIDDLCAELETQRIDEVQARFERIYPYLKRRTLNRRIVARILRVDDEQLLCLLDIFKRGDNDYEQFLDAPIEYGRSHLEPQLEIQRLRNWVQEQKIQQRPTQQLPELPSELHPWLELPGWEMASLTEDWVIYESEEWVAQFRKPEIHNAWDTYYQIISGIRSETNQAEEFADISNVKLCGSNNHYVLYSQPFTTDTGIIGVLFLLAPFDHKPSREEIIEVGKRTTLFDVPVEAGEDDTITLEEENTADNAKNVSKESPQLIKSQSKASYNILARQLNLCDLTPFARRSYPAYLLADEESWLAIERGKEANLALSAEEEQILKSVSTSAPGKGSLPLFINGRAGSGKSTMLLYLFADYCYRKYYKQGHRRTEPLPGEPLFLTYNERLLEVARDGVKTLLSSHHRFVAERSQGDERDRIDHFFQPFQQFLFGLLSPEERQRFDLEKYISFHRFKQLYQGKSPSESLAKVVLHLPEARQYSPEICWHVIRSFIKGYNLEECITPEDYQKDVPRKERTISIEKFQGIYYTIWERWYKRITQEQGYWDDQDLIARVLKLKCYRPEYTAIFCDEAQDFTRLELQLIMRLSIFSQYHLGYQPIHCLPFAFAGDPFQTLNPTGFHWSSVQAVFDAEVITALDPAEQLKLVINFQELSFNYRSSPPIVQVTNLIQLWRHVLFDIHELQPQTPWQQGNFPSPQKFILNANINTEQLADYIKDTIIIVPCEEGEEAAYAQADEVLSEIFPQSLESEPLKNVLSAISAKGLEFKKVILYKFGEDCNRSVWNLRSQSTDQRVKVEYFFNKLYVAASRATERLFVVDSEKGDRQLWQYASDEALLQAILRHARNKARWEASVQTISIGTPKTAQELREDDPVSIAQEFERKGLNSQNPGLLRRARQFYSDFGNTVKANFCEAWAFKFEEQFQTAGSLFLQVGEADEAWECFWEGLCWSELVTWCNQHPESHTVEGEIANFMVAPLQDLQALNNFTLVISNQLSVVSDDAKTQLTTDNKLLTHHKQWKKAVEEYAKRLEMLLNDAEFNFNGWQQWGEVLETLESAGYTGSNLLAGECFYRAKNYERAVRNWEEGGATQKSEYNQAKVLLLGYPDGLEYLEKAGEADRIITEWERAVKPRDRRWLKYVAPSLEAKHQYEQAFVVYVWLDELVKLKACFETASQGTPKFKLFTVLFQYFYRKKHFADAIEAVERYLPNVVGSEHQKAGLKFDVVYEIACSELTPDDLTKGYRKRYERFIKEQILSSSEWQDYLSIQQLGVALEKIGSIVETLEFYEQFVGHSEEHLRQFARERWIATKKRQEDYARKQKQFDKASKTHSEMLKKARNWSIQQQAVPLEPPLSPKERPTPLIPESAAIQTSSKSPTATKLVIKGLLTNTKVEQLEAGVVRFSVRHLVIKVMRHSKQVLITDALNSREVRVDGAQSKISIGEAIVEAVGSKQLSFALSTSGYSGNLIYDLEKLHLELNIQGYPHKISIEL
ncbi:hypothetical protein H6F98_02055 [Microcoleus sp. FACHB-SPT15]|uniref:hypothetical protein n=1 Tax=Microcoleus sp. FACHB-SPT15 TaxID=2692830 RepID=UPI001780FB23|nr:hypothetical protein [Microcoleus sp. FACHB-SPT15]MBD1804258.1 hypothetical protein [Microcoleus sp. FACHB-SPT15]